MIVKTMRVTQGRLKAEVIVGTNELGGNVVLLVDVDRRKQEVQDALATFENLMLREAKRLVREGGTRGEVERLAKERSAELVAAANGRSKSAVREALTTIQRAVELALTGSRQIETPTFTGPAVSTSVVTNLQSRIARQIEEVGA